MYHRLTIIVVVLSTAVAVALIYCLISIHSKILSPRRILIDTAPLSKRPNQTQNTDKDLRNWSPRPHVTGNIELHEI